MSKTKGSSPKVKNAKARRGTQPGDKVVNRKGGGTPPPAVVSNPNKIAGICLAILAAATTYLGDHKSPKLEARLRQAIGLEVNDTDLALTLTDKEKRLVGEALSYAVKIVPDSAKLPEPIQVNEPASETQPKRRRTPQPGPKVVPLRRIVPAGNMPVSQIAQVFSQPAEEQPEPEVRIAHIPAKADNSALARILAATRA